MQILLSLQDVIPEIRIVAGAHYEYFVERLQPPAHLKH